MWCRSGLGVTVAALALAVGGCYGVEPLAVGKPSTGETTSQAGTGGSLNPDRRPNTSSPDPGSGPYVAGTRAVPPPTDPSPVPRAGGRAPGEVLAACPSNLPVPAICLLCSDGSCGTAYCRDGKFVDYRCPAGKEPCVIGGCGGDVCKEASYGTAPTAQCDWLPEYACYRTAQCTRQGNGRCGWTPSAELDACIANSRGYVDAGW